MVFSAVALAVALLPGALTWFWGRPLVRATDDPTLPERVLGWRSRAAAATAAGMAVLIVMLPGEAPWALPLLVVVRLAGGFPARRTLHGETWDFVAYLSQMGRVTIGVAGFWLVILLAPVLVAGAGAHTWAVAGGLAVVLVLWGLAYHRILLPVLGATPLDRPELQEHFEAIAERSTAPRPRVWVVGHPQGRTANAFTLPATKASSVVFTRTLLEEFEPDEIGAVFAHEQAHLEHFTPARVWRLALLQTVVVLAGTLGAAWALERFEAFRFWILLGWPVLLLAAAVVRLVRHRQHEADSDRRAVELCGDARALGRALVRLHTLALLPRRLTVEQESQATHPSLANRLRALEELAGGPEPGVGDEGTAAAAPLSTGGATPPLPAVLAGAAGGKWVLLGEQQVHWLEGVSEETSREAGALRAAALRVRTLAYSELVELRLKPRGADHALVASDRVGAEWSVPLAAGEGAAAHAALNLVDRRLAPPTAARPERKLLGSIVACTTAIMALLSWTAAALPALLAVVLPHPAALAACGASALAAVVISLVRGGTPGPVFDPALHPAATVGLAVFGIAALWIAWTTAWRERAGRTWSAPWVALALGLLGAAFLVVPTLAWVTGGALRGHVVAREHPGGAVLLIGAMAALLVVPARWGRVAAGIAGVLAVVPLVVGSGLFAERFVDDPFFAPGVTEEVAETHVLDLIDEQTLPDTSGQMALSPSGESWAILQIDYDEESSVPTSRVIVGSASGPQHTHEAAVLVLLDDERLLTLDTTGDRTVVEQRPHDPEAPALWRTELEPLVEGAQLRADPTTGRWRVTGLTDAGELVRASGRDDGSFDLDRWAPGSTGASWIVGDGAAALGFAFHADDIDAFSDEFDEATPALWWLLAGSLQVGFGGTVLALDGSGARELFETELQVQCEAPPPGRTSLLCRANDGSRTTFWRVDPASGDRSALGRVPGFGWPAQPQARGWLVLVNAGQQQHLYRVDDDGLTRLDVGGTPPWIQAAASFDGGVGVLVYDGGESVLRRYALP